MLNAKSNKEIVAAGHAFAKNLSADTGLMDMAKMVSELATRLDVALVRGDKLAKQRDALAAEAGYLRDAIKQHSQSTHFCEVCGKDDPCKNDDVCWSLNHELPVTDAYLNSLRSEGVEMFAARLRSDATELSVCKMIALGADDFAAQLRAGEAK